MEPFTNIDQDLCRILSGFEWKGTFISSKLLIYISSEFYEIINFGKYLKKHIFNAFVRDEDDH